MRTHRHSHQPAIRETRSSEFHMMPNPTHISPHAPVFSFQTPARARNNPISISSPPYPATHAPSQPPSKILSMRHALQYSPPPGTVYPIRPQSSHPTADSPPRSRCARLGAISITVTNSISIFNQVRSEIVRYKKILFLPLLHACLGYRASSPLH